jgi:hypothetical protein
MRNRTLWFASLLLTCALASADEEAPYTAEQLASAKPASFHAGVFDSLNKYSQDKDATAILVNCWVAYGFSNDNVSRCFLANPQHRKRILADVERLANRAKIDWADIDGSPERTMIYFRVLLTRDGDQTQVHYFENWGYDNEKYGYDYRSPQRLSMYPRAQQRSRCSGQNLMYIVNVGVDGKAKGEVRFETVKGKISSECQEYMQERVGDYIFIPGQFNGEVVESQFVGLIMS